MFRSVSFLLLLGTNVGTIWAHCPDGWTQFGESCYLFGHEQLNFDEAQSFCGHYGGQIVNIETEEENQFLVGILRTLKATTHWIGLTDQVVEGLWRWYPSEDVPEFLDWDHDQPNAALDGNCAVMYEDRSYHWCDRSCQEKDNAICEIPTEDEESVIG